MISDIGSTDDTALICHTNHAATTNSSATWNMGYINSGGDWVAPSGIAVDHSFAVPGFRRMRLPMMVNLLRHYNGTPSEGIYHCLIEDDTGTEHIIYVGLYNSGGGKIRVYACTLKLNF